MSTPEHIAEGAGAFKAPVNPEGYPVATEQELRAVRLHGEGREFDFSEIGADRQLVLHLGEGNDYLGITEQTPSKLARLRGKTSKFVVTARNAEIPGSEHVMAELTEPTQELSVGRNRQRNIMFDGSVSRDHLRIRRIEDRIIVEDTSTFGTSANLGYRQ